MWTTINIVLLIIGILLFIYAKYIDSSENSEALTLFIFGAFFVVVSALSALTKVIIGLF